MGTQLQLARRQEPFGRSHFAHLSAIPFLRFFEIAGHMNHPFDHL